MGESIEINEHWLMEWFEFGYIELVVYLSKWARFDEWLEKHEQ